MGGGSVTHGTGGKASEQAALAGRLQGSGERDRAGAAAWGSGLQGRALGLKAELNCGLVHTMRTYEKRDKADTGRNKRANWVEPGAKAAGEALRGKAWCQRTSQKLFLKDEAHISGVFHKPLQEVRFIS